ncbi:TraB/GumN family protein [Qipengyuania sp. JC766]|uniref:TraB/GumN family protein n=1 Tax=Qipengyuania sp. JC766 TaxID=3232139 RepID=UPI003458CCA3
MKSTFKSLALAASSLSLLFAGAGCAPMDGARSASSDAAMWQKPAGAEGPAMWKVSDEDTTIYLFGTIHVLPEGLDWYTPTVANALTGSDIMVTEILGDAMSDTETAQLMQTKGMLPQGTTLRSLLDEEQTAKYEAALAKIGIPAANFDGFKPWSVALTLSVLPLIQEGYKIDEGVEQKLEEYAGEDLARGNLETVGEQLAIFDNLPQEDQIEFLMAAAEETDNLKSYIDRMVEQWMAGNPEALAETMNESLEDDPALAEALLYRRNRNWVEWIDTRMDQPGTVFIAVGAGHLAGDKSVQDYLAQRDIEVVRVQ